MQGESRKQRRRRKVQERYAAREVIKHVKQRQLMQRTAEYIANEIAREAIPLLTASIQNAGQSLAEVAKAMYALFDDTGRGEGVGTAQSEQGAAGSAEAEDDSRSSRTR